MRLSILVAAALALTTMAPAFADETMTTTTIQQDSIPVAPIVETAPVIETTPVIVTPPANNETVIVKKKDKHLLRLGVPGLVHFDVF